MEQIESEGGAARILPFFEQPGVVRGLIPAGPGVPFGIASVSHPGLGIGGVYGTWGQCYDNMELPRFIEQRLGDILPPDEKLEPGTLGFNYRHHIANLSPEEHMQVEIELGVRFLKEAAAACGWRPEEVDAVLLGMSAPVSDDYTERIATAAGIPASALKLSVHKACDSSMGALHLALNAGLSAAYQVGRNLAEELKGKKVLVGGIEGLSRFLYRSHDTNALQLFGNAAGVIGIIPGETMSFITGKAHEVFDDKGVLAVRMYYPHSRQVEPDRSKVEVYNVGPNHLRFAGMMHEPESDEPVDMAGPMGMVKLFVRSGVQVVSEVVQAYQAKMSAAGNPARSFATAIVHHANYKINQLKAAQLAKSGISIPMPWLLSEFGNVSAASNMIAFLRQLPGLKPGDHILFDGFGAGTYYDVFAVALGDQA